MFIISLHVVIEKHCHWKSCFLTFWELWICSQMKCGSWVSLAWLGLTCGHGVTWNAFISATHKIKQTKKSVSFLIMKIYFFICIQRSLVQKISQIVKFWRISKRGCKSRLYQYSSTVQIRVPDIEKVVKWGKHTNKYIYSLRNLNWSYRPIPLGSQFKGFHIHQL